MERLIQDLRFAFRLLLRRPVFTAVAVGSLALGIGANTAIFSLVNELFLRPLPVAQPAHLVALFTVDERNPGLAPLSHLNWQDLRDPRGPFTGVGGYDFTAMSVAGRDEPRRVTGLLVSGNYFDLLGVRARHGRTFTAGDDTTPGAHPVAVLGHAFFLEHLGGDPAAVGREIVLNGQPFTVLGVAPPSFRGLNVGLEPAVYAPMAMNATFRPNPDLNWYDERRGLFVFGFARLRPEVDLEQARAQLRLVGERLAAEYPLENKGRNFDALAIAQATVPPPQRAGLVAGTTLLMSTVGLVLLIASVNVANLLLARAAARRREIAVRLSIGVPRGRLVAQLLTESTVIALAGGGVGVVVALAIVRLLRRMFGALPLFGPGFGLELALDARVLLFTLGLSVLTGLVFGLLPAIQGSRPEVVGALKQGDVAPSKRRFALREALVVAQLALSLIALLCSGLFLRSLQAAQKIELGYDPSHLAAVTFDATLGGFAPERAAQRYRELGEAVAALPGVRAATLTGTPPMQGTLLRSVLLPDQAADAERTFVSVAPIDEKYFDAMGISLETGRAFTTADHPAGARVVIVNQTMAKTLWPGKEALGQRFSFFGQEPVEVVGIAHDIKYQNPGEDPQPYTYVPLAQAFVAPVAVIARTQGTPGPVVLQIRRELERINRAVPILAGTTVPELVRDALLPARFAALFLAVLGGLALVLAAIGIYGVMSFAVARRTREIGIRIAMGADGDRVLRLVMRQGVVLALLGLGVGVGVGIAVTRLLRNLLFVSPSDPLAYAATAGVLLLVTLVACLVPALRAMRVDPIRVLRQE